MYHYSTHTCTCTTTVHTHTCTTTVHTHVLHTHVLLQYTHMYYYTHMYHSGTHMYYCSTHMYYYTHMYVLLHSHVPLRYTHVLHTKIKEGYSTFYNGVNHFNRHSPIPQASNYTRTPVIDDRFHRNRNYTRTMLSTINIIIVDRATQDRKRFNR